QASVPTIVGVMRSTRSRARDSRSHSSGPVPCTRRRTTDASRFARSANLRSPRLTSWHKLIPQPMEPDFGSKAARCPARPPSTQRPRSAATHEADSARGADRDEAGGQSQGNQSGSKPQVLGEQANDGGTEHEPEIANRRDTAHDEGGSVAA